MTRDDVIKIFMKRDKMSKKEATEYFEDCVAAVQQDIFDGHDAVLTWEDMTSLESDYFINCMIEGVFG